MKLWRTSLTVVLAGLFSLPVPPAVATCCAPLTAPMPMGCCEPGQCHCEVSAPLPSAPDAKAPAILPVAPESVALLPVLDGPVQHAAERRPVSCAGADGMVVTVPLFVLTHSFLI